MAAWAGACQVQDLRHHVGERDGGADLMIGRLAQQRLDRGQVTENLVHVAACLAVRVTGPGRQPVDQGPCGRAGAAGRLVRRRAGHRGGIWAELSDVRRFANSGDVVRHTGRDITVYSSDTKRAAEPLSRQGPPTDGCVASNTADEIGKPECRACSCG